MPHPDFTLPPSDFSRPPPDVSLVIPTLNEGKRLPRFLADLDAAFRLSGGHVEVIVVDDGSAAEHQEVCARAVRDLGTISGQFIELGRHRGKGAAVRTGLLAAGGSWIGWVDADGAVPAQEVTRVVALLDDEAPDVFLAARVRMLGRTVNRDPLRHILGRAFAGWATTLLSLPVYDSQCGLKLLRKDSTLEHVEACVEEGFLFDLELLARCHRAGLRLREVPVDWADIPGNKVRPLRDGIRMAAGVLKVRSRLGKP